jgi:ABC transporter with metal-binding/Fe-S-binding domain ATP-binding protein
MNVAVLFSGGKDSTCALGKALEYGHTISCLITMKSSNSESYMFQSVGNEFVSLQAEALELPSIEFETCGIKEKELEDLTSAIKHAKEKYGIEGIVTGAIKSAYQSSRIQTICNDLDLWCINPLWQRDEVEFIKELLDKEFTIVLLGVFSYPLTKEYLGRIYTDELLDEFLELGEKFGLSVAGEGGEFESFILDCPYFKKRLVIGESEKIMDSENSGVLNIKKIYLEEK